MTSPYMTGTVSVTAGSAVVTGSGTAWQIALIAGGMFGLDSSNGNPVPILSVDSDTQLTLAKPWRGTTASGQPYWIVRDTAYLQQMVSNAQALATYIQRLDNASLAALAGLTPAQDKVAYFTGAGSAALADFKSARSLLALNASADKFPYFNSSAAPALASLSGLARNLLDDPTSDDMLATLAFSTYFKSLRTAGSRAALLNLIKVLHTFSINDDSVVTFDLATNVFVGMCLISTNTSSFGGFLKGVYSIRSAGSPYVQAIAAIGTGQTSTSLLTGTTGTDGFMTLSCSGNGIVQVENRTGGAVTVAMSILEAYSA